MPARSEREIRGRQGVGSPPALLADGPEAPRGGPSTSIRQRVFAAATALLLFAGVGTVAFAAFRSGSDRSAHGVVGDGEVVIHLIGGNAPRAILTYGDERQEGVQDSYTWCDGEECVGGAGTFAYWPPISEYVIVMPGVPIRFGGDGTVEKLRITGPSGEPVDTGGAVVPGENGRYLLELAATWPEGDASFYFGVEALSDLAAAPDVLRVECDYRPQTYASIIRTSLEGLRLEFTETGGWDGFEIVSPEGTPPEEFFGVGGNFVDGTTSIPLPPGRWEIGCARADAALVPGDRTAAFELVDPDDHFAPVDLACPDAVEEPFASTVEVATSHDEAVGRVLHGLAEGDRVRGSGYSADDWKIGLTYVVDRGGVAVARVVLGQNDATWAGTLLACPDSGIGLSAAATPVTQ